MFQLKSMDKSELEEYLDEVRRLEVKITCTDNTCEQIIDEYMRKTLNDSNFVQYTFIGKVDEFEKDIKCLPMGTKVTLTILKTWEFAGTDMKMLYQIGEMGLDMNRIIVVETDKKGEYGVEIIAPINHTPFISDLEEFEQIWSEDILPDIKKCGEVNLIQALMNIHLINYTEKKVCFSSTTPMAIEILSEYWRRSHIMKCIEEHLGKRCDVEFVLEDDRVKIFEYSDTYSEQAKDLLVQLQQHLIEIDDEDTLIMQEGYREHYFEHVLKCAYENEGIIFLAEKNNRVVGLVAGMIEMPDAEDKLVNRCPQKGRITELVVSDEMHGRGIGRRLVEDMETYFENKGCEFSRISVLSKNAKARRLYSNLEYRSIEIEMSKKLCK